MAPVISVKGARRTGKARYVKVAVDTWLWRRVKMIAALEGRLIPEIMDEALDTYISIWDNRQGDDGVRT